MMGRVYFCGGGRHPEPMTCLRVLDLLGRADAVVHDGALGGDLLRHASPAAEIVDAAPLSQADAIARLRELAGRHPLVLRLTDEQPFVAGRGSAEAEALARSGVPFEVVPGVPRAIAAAIRAGIPLTHPGISSGFTVLSASPDMALDVEGLAPGGGTVVVLTSEDRVRDDCDALMDAGFSPDAPVALIIDGASPVERVVEATISTLSPGMEPRPGRAAVCVVGSVVRLRESLAWAERRPLFGKRVVVTRPRAQAAAFTAELEALGAEVVQFPTIRIVDPVDPEPLRRAAAEADRFDWIVFTSVNGVERFWRCLRAAGLDTRALGGVSLCAIGPATAAAIELEGARADLVPERFVAEAVVDALTGEFDLRGSRVLLPRAEIARSVLPDQLREHGAEVVEVDAYRTILDGDQVEIVRRGLDEGVIDLITFTASSTVRNFVELVGTGVGGARIGCIGPITAGTARELGLPVHFEAEEHTIPGLLRAIREHYEGSAR